MAASMLNNVSIASKKEPTIADSKSVMTGAETTRNIQNKVSSNSEDTKPFFSDYKKPYISNIYLLFLTNHINRAYVRA